MNTFVPAGAAPAAVLPLRNRPPIRPGRSSPPPACSYLVWSAASVLREDERAIVRAASHASKAADWLLGRMPDAEEAPRIAEDAGEAVLADAAAAAEEA